MNTHCILVDGSSFFYRAFHALPPLVNSKGQATGAIYGVASMLKKLLTQHQPEYIAVIFDAPGKTFREDIYPEYKAHRPPTPPDLKSQYQPLVKLIEFLGIPVFAIPGVEADDVIGTLAKKAEHQGIPVTIATSDKDFAQMVNDHITLYNSMSEQWLDVAGVTQKYDIHPQQFRDYLSLIGDTSDNIPGVPKCGPKTASKWLQTYGTLENIINHAQDISGKVGEYLRETIPFFPISQQLVTIKCDLDLNIQIADLKPSPTQELAIYQLAEDLEFKSWLKNRPEVSATQPIQKLSVQIIHSIPDLQNYLDALDPKSILVVDTETDSLDPMQAQIIGISLCTHLENACYIPLAHEEQLNCPRDETLSLLKPILENPYRPKVGQNIKYDVHVLLNCGIHLQGIYADTMLQSYVLNSTATRHDLGTLAKKYLNLDSISYEDVVGKGAKQVPFAKIDIAKAAEYSGEDVLLTLQLYHYFEQHLSVVEKQLVHEIEIPVSIILAQMERYGVAIDCERLQLLGVKLKQRLQRLQTQAWEQAGQEFNLQSPKQLAEILYTKLQLPVLSKTPSGQPSTAEEVLQNLAQDYALPHILIEHRRLSKLLSTYVDALPKRLNSNTQRVHTSYNQAITSTGRLSSSDPNLQNIPVRTEEGRMIRKAFIAKPSAIILTADYSQIELRLMAHFSKDPLLLKAFNNNHDVHQATASEVFGIPMDQVTSEARRQAKTINFGLIYGMSAFGLAKQLNISRQDAQKYIDLYFHRYQGVHRYMEQAKQLAHQQGYVETLMGRRLYIPDIHSKNMGKVKAAERVAINAPLQGTAADLIKKAMIHIDQCLKAHPEIKAQMILQVHDELVFEIHPDDVAVFQPILKSCMEQVVHLDVPLLVNIGQGQNWEEAH
jgi:DNA polymerase-1